MYVCTIEGKKGYGGGGQGAGGPERAETDVDSSGDDVSLYQHACMHQRRLRALRHIGICLKRSFCLDLQI